jgi:hypothetical protein
MSYQFALFLNVPSGGDPRALTLRCQNVVLPGISNDEVQVALHGVEVNYNGRPVYPRTFASTFLETRDLPVRDAIRGWIEYARNARNNTGTYKAQYESTGDLVLYDDQNNVIRTIRFYGLFPQMMDEPQMDGSQSTAIMLTTTWKYDYHADQ